MCGIAGLVRFGDRAKENIERMKERMAHRGPDANGTWHNADGSVWFGHQRLSINDLSETGSQPFTSRSGRLTMVYNGEIYNFAEIREKLKAHGFTAFKGTSDTEVFLEAMEAFGMEEALRLSRGMFAFAVYDAETGSITLGRDRIGEKPLHYGFVNGAFVFASDLGSVQVLEGFANPIFREVLPVYFCHGYIPAPYTIYEGIRKLVPGTLATIKPPYTENDLSERPYWSVKDVALKGQANPFSGSFDEAVAELERLLKRSVREQMLSSDVPVGAFLSAGIDSSTVVALMQAQSGGKVRSFTIGMDDPKFNEAVYAAEIAKHLGTSHTELYITEKDCKEVIPLLPAMFAEPFADSSQIPTYLVSKMTREHVTVSLSGDAGDELFAGYNVYRSIERIWGKLRRVPAPLRKVGGTMWQTLPLPRRSLGKLAAAASPEELYRRMPERDPLTMALPLVKKDIPFAYSEVGNNLFADPTHSIMLMDMLMYHPDDILVKVDRTAMAVSLETRVPLLDREVVEFAFSLPIDYLVRTNERGEREGKQVLREVLYRYVPKEMMDRPKKGFSIPIMKWLKEKELRAWAEDLLQEDRIRREGLLDPAAVRAVWNAFIEKDEWRDQIWFLLMFQAFMRENGQSA